MLIDLKMSLGEKSMTKAMRWQQARIKGRQLHTCTYVCAVDYTVAASGLYLMLQHASIFVVEHISLNFCCNFELRAMRADAVSCFCQLFNFF